MKIPGNRVGCPVLRFVHIILLAVLVRSAVYVSRERIEGNWGKKESGSIFEGVGFTDSTGSDEKGLEDF